MKRMVDVKIEDGTVTSIDGAAVGVNHLYKHDCQVSRGSPSAPGRIFVTIYNDSPDALKKYGQRGNSAPILTGFYQTSEQDKYSLVPLALEYQENETHDKFYYALINATTGLPSRGEVHVYDSDNISKDRVTKIF